MNLSAQNKKGFTLIELLVVIGILAVLLAITLIAINPARQFAQANNTKRASDVNAILNAINQYMVDKKGVVPSGIDTALKNIGSAVGDADICGDLVATYIAQMPFDPKTGSWTSCATYDSQYSVVQGSADNRITVSAPDTEAPLTTPISVTR